jgi:hypothetical protein
MTIIAIIIAAALTAVDASPPCIMSRDWVVVSSDLFGVGSWAVTIYEDGVFEASSAPATRASGTLSPEATARLRAQLHALPRQLTSYSYGRQTVDSYMLMLSVSEAGKRRTYHVGDQIREGCGEDCITTIRIAKDLFRLLPLADQQQALKPWLKDGDGR